MADENFVLPEKLIKSKKERANNDEARENNVANCMNWVKSHNEAEAHQKNKNWRDTTNWESFGKEFPQVAEYCKWMKRHKLHPPINGGFLTQSQSPTTGRWVMLDGRGLIAGIEDNRWPNLEITPLEKIYKLYPGCHS